MENQQPNKKTITGGIDLFEEIEFTSDDDGLLVACLNKLSEISKKQVADLKLPVYLERKKSPDTLEF